VPAQDDDDMTQPAKADDDIGYEPGPANNDNSLVNGMRVRRLLIGRFQHQPFAV